MGGRGDPLCVGGDPLCMPEESHCVCVGGDPLCCEQTQLRGWPPKPRPQGVAPAPVTAPRGHCSYSKPCKTPPSAQDVGCVMCRPAGCLQRLSLWHTGVFGGSRRKSKRRPLESRAGRLLFPGDPQGDSRPNTSQEDAHEGGPEPLLIQVREGVTHTGPPWSGRACPYH